MGVWPADTYPHPEPPAGTPKDEKWAEAVGVVRDYCRWHVAPEVTEEVTVDGPGGAVLHLPTLRLVELSSITNDGEPVADPDWLTSGMVRGCWTGRGRGVVATMTHGLHAWPDDLLKVVREVAASVVQPGIAQISSSNHQVTYEPSVTGRQRAVMDKYRLVGL